MVLAISRPENVSAQKNISVPTARSCDVQAELDPETGAVVMASVTAPLVSVRAMLGGSTASEKIVTGAHALAAAPGMVHALTELACATKDSRATTAKLRCAREPQCAEAVAHATAPMEPARAGKASRAKPVNWKHAPITATGKEAVVQMENAHVLLVIPVTTAAHDLSCTARF